MTIVTLKPTLGLGRIRVGLSSVDRAVRIVDTGQLQAIAYSSRVERSFSFLDLCGFTDFADSEGDEAAVEEARCLRQVVREVVAAVRRTGREVARRRRDDGRRRDRAARRRRRCHRAARHGCMPVAAAGGHRERVRTAGRRRRLHRSRRQHRGAVVRRGRPWPGAGGDRRHSTFPTGWRRPTQWSCACVGWPSRSNVVELTAALNLPTVLDGRIAPAGRSPRLLEGITRPVRSKRGA